MKKPDFSFLDAAEYEYLLADVKRYLNTRLELFKLDCLDKLARVLGVVLLGLALILILFAIIGLGGVAVIFALSAYLPAWAATLIVMGVWCLILCLVILLRKQLFFYPMLLAVSSILFADEPKRNEQQLAQDRAILSAREEEQVQNIQHQVERIQNNWKRVTDFFKWIRSLLP
mgnify:CR=1 FL=1